MFDEVTINEIDAIAILNKDESHFLDFVDKIDSGVSVQKKCCSFANSDGGELYIGVIDKKNQPIRAGIFGRWNGFINDEEANSMIQNTFLHIHPNIRDITYEFLLIANHSEFGKVLKVTIEKSPEVHETASKKTFIRKSAQCFEIFGNDI
jgi:ATP-dependent DNA helicase RecG